MWMYMYSIDTYTSLYIERVNTCIHFFFFLYTSGQLSWSFPVDTGTSTSAWPETRGGLGGLKPPQIFPLILIFKY